MGLMDILKKYIFTSHHLRKIRARYMCTVARTGDRRANRCKDLTGSLKSPSMLRGQGRKNAGT